MRQKVTFAPTGKGSATTARVTIPSAYVELMKISKDNRDVDITFEDGKIIITKAK